MLQIYLPWCFLKVLFHWSSRNYGKRKNNIHVGESLLTWHPVILRDTEQPVIYKFKVLERGDPHEHSSKVMKSWWCECFWRHTVDEWQDIDESQGMLHFFKRERILPFGRLRKSSVLHSVLIDEIFTIWKLAEARHSIQS